MANMISIDITELRKIDVPAPVRNLAEHSCNALSQSRSVASGLIALLEDFESDFAANRGTSPKKLHAALDLARVLEDRLDSTVTDLGSLV